ncbi:MAG: LysR family transcriptional regulator [Xanthomonadales bacterium]|nr:LysR family transcriptional regulator [Xanthomonadales bacterium]
MNLQALRAFVSVVQCGSFTGAAELLRSQKARISRQVSELEAELGVRLLERSTRALHLTEIGREIHERALGILAAIEDTEQIAQAMHGEPRGLLRLTVPLEFGLIAAFDWVSALLARYPRLAIEVDSSSRIVDLVHEGYDLAIRVGPLPDSRLAARRLGELRYGLYAAPDYLQRRGMPQSPADLSDHDLISFAPGGKPSRLRLQRPGESTDLGDVSPRLRVDSRHAQRQALVAGLGIADSLLLLAEPEVVAGRLVRVLPDWSPAAVPVHAVFPSHRFLTPKVRAFVEHAQANFPASARAPDQGSG